jgi:hypothetical protein
MSENLRNVGSHGKKILQVIHMQESEEVVLQVLFQPS